MSKNRQKVDKFKRNELLLNLIFVAFFYCKNATIIGLKRSSIRLNLSTFLPEQYICQLFTSSWVGKVPKIDYFGIRLESQ